MNCIICRKEINNQENYFKVELFKKGKFFERAFAHQVCWLKRNQVGSQLGNLVNGLTNYAKEMGVIKEKPIEVRI